MKLICFLKGIWRTIINLYPFSGHDFIEIYDNKDIQVLECEICRYVSVGFKNERIRGRK